MASVYRSCSICGQTWAFDPRDPGYGDSFKANHEAMHRSSPGAGSSAGGGSASGGFSPGQMAALGGAAAIGGAVGGAVGNAIRSQLFPTAQEKAAKEAHIQAIVQAREARERDQLERERQEAEARERAFQKGKNALLGAMREIGGEKYDVADDGPMEWREVDDVFRTARIEATFGQTDTHLPLPTLDELERMVPPVSAPVPTTESLLQESQAKARFEAFEKEQQIKADQEAFAKAQAAVIEAKKRGEESSRQAREAESRAKQAQELVAKQQAPHSAMDEALEALRAAQDADRIASKALEEAQLDKNSAKYKLQRSTKELEEMQGKKEGK